MKLAIKPKAPAYVLPTEQNEPSDTIGSYSMLLYGRKKIGKTSLAAEFPGAFIISCEPGAKALRVYKEEVRDWIKAQQVIDAVCKSDRFETIVVDTIDLLYDFIFDQICTKQMIEHPNDENDFGATWRKIRKAFRIEIQKLLTCGKGVIFLSHDTEREVEDREGGKFDRIQPTMAKQAMEEVEGVVDLIGLYDYDGDKRVLRVAGDQFMVAGCRCKENFIRKGGEAGEAADRIRVIDMGSSSQESYANLVNAFNNQQVLVDLPKPEKVKKVLTKLAPNKPNSKE
jgi:hypothetical protein